MWDIFGYNPWEEWEFGLTIYDTWNKKYIEWGSGWDIVGGVEYYDPDVTDQKEAYVWEYIVKVPDQPAVEPDQVF